ncbi:MAG: hypothetical protein Q9M91_07790 [Candidatus Dojkabacteria bacterium]|nr:hypothetical protein [Candidatus Dojkabacteria bacterium]MDQ7021687.1 hypothetical protein [Candidatus Dojkabacteria bacterium]
MNLGRDDIDLFSEKRQDELYAALPLDEDRSSSKLSKKFEKYDQPSFYDIELEDGYKVGDYLLNHPGITALNRNVVDDIMALHSIVFHCHSHQPDIKSINSYNVITDLYDVLDKGNKFAFQCEIARRVVLLADDFKEDLYNETVIMVYQLINVRNNTTQYSKLDVSYADAKGMLTSMVKVVYSLRAKKRYINRNMEKNLKVLKYILALYRAWFWLGVWLIFYLTIPDYEGIGFLESSMF